MRVTGLLGSLGLFGDSGRIGNGRVGRVGGSLVLGWRICSWRRGGLSLG